MKKEDYDRANIFMACVTEMANHNSDFLFIFSGSKSARNFQFAAEQMLATNSITKDLTLQQSKGIIRINNLGSFYFSSIESNTIIGWQGGIIIDPVLDEMELVSPAIEMKLIDAKHRASVVNNRLLEKRRKQNYENYQQS